MNPGFNVSDDLRFSKFLYLIQKFTSGRAVPHVPNSRLLFVIGQRICSGLRNIS